MTLDEQEEAALTALRDTSGGYYDTPERFHLPAAVVRAFVRGVLTVQPVITLDELIETAGKAGIPRGTLVRVGRNEPVPAPTPEPSRWATRTRLTIPLL